MTALVPRRFLVIDEHHASRFATSVALQQRGYVCLQVAGASEALSAIDTYAPDVVLLEWEFRDGSGIGLARRLRQRAASYDHALILIATSAQAETVGFRDSEELDAYLVKPTTVDEIEAALGSLLEENAHAP
jgi:two-component system response regulator MprA